MAIYQNNALLEYPTYGLDMIGKIKDDELHFYLKDHLGSIRATIYDNKLMSAQDYDAWGYILEGRTYESEEGKFKFTGKERDEESFYDYFGARYYDARIGRWGQVEPLLENYISWSPFQYGKCNPMKLKDIDGKIVVLQNIDQARYFNRVADLLQNQELSNEFSDLIASVRISSNRDLIITNYEGSNELIGVTGQIKYKLSGEFSKTDAIGIGLSSDFFDIENEYVSAVLLEHELYHLNYYVNELGLKTGTELSKWQESHEKQFLVHELKAITHSIGKFKELYKAKKISKKEYREAIRNLKDYENQTKERLSEFI